ncbi:MULTISPECIES: hypothetical protein [unclassified Undibacterium]|uniref:hypothetical protein n=1 Tax=unclassified Undibacterium TaxID=2630295 RepID=UPI002AC97D16|nr:MULTISPECIES: hypothetical protein [unclassified Undibacterium]MEB0140175.1 hypothetical protein [Undibacterium sp. CCC2.1]MEB0172451.1 hypothetical protein [Undibacterium sp. CCC1.1]MEB0176969.1 hypothetical protein [Undibacterium sp. CCC3.4]MEB0215573.1 hypothetical protein [Undibacterium sp. 5I2]WPX43720.1 hypothetical protein RHM61_00325 [Undibacterium sp. CCC3.4]
MNIKLTYVNRADMASQDVPTLLIFQKQNAGDQDSALVWKVIRHCRHTHFHPMVFSTDRQLSLGDDFGNYSALIPVANGKEFKVALSGSKPQLHAVSSSDTPAGVSMLNHMSANSFKACLFVQGQLLAMRPAVTPGAEDEFLLENTLWAVIDHRDPSSEAVGPRWPGKKRPIRPGDPVSIALLDSAIPIPLAGVASANLILYGSPANLTLKLENIVLV